MDGRGLLSHSGTAALRELADGIGLTDALSAAAAPVSAAGLIHEPGAVLRDLVVMLADGGDDFSGIETLRGHQADLDGPVASDSTAWRRVADLAGHELSVARLDAARKRVRATVWRHGGAPPAVDAGSGLVWVDIDATLVTVHSDKEAAAGTYKRGYGFHPLLAYLDRDDGTGEALAGRLRPGNAGANTAADHIDIFETAIDQLTGVDPARVLVRADSAGSAQAFLRYLGEAGVEFSVGARLDDQVRAAIRIAASRPECWVPAVRQTGEVRDGAHVTEITAHVDVSAYPTGTRVLVRREPLHPGAQQTFDDLDGHRFTALLTTQQDADLGALDARHRAHARVEQRIRDAKPSACATCHQPTSRSTRSGCNSSCSPKTCSPGSPSWPTTATSPWPPPPPCATGCCTSPDASPAAADASHYTSTLPDHGPPTSPRRSEDSASCPRPRNHDSPPADPHPPAAGLQPRRHTCPITSPVLHPSNRDHEQHHPSTVTPKRQPQRQTREESGLGRAQVSSDGLGQPDDSQNWRGGQRRDLRGDRLG